MRKIIQLTELPSEFGVSVWFRVFILYEFICQFTGTGLRHSDTCRHHGACQCVPWCNLPSSPKQGSNPSLLLLTEIGNVSEEPGASTCSETATYIRGQHWLEICRHFLLLDTHLNVVRESVCVRKAENHTVKSLDSVERLKS